MSATDSTSDEEQSDAMFPPSDDESLAPPQSVLSMCAKEHSCAAVETNQDADGLRTELDVADSLRAALDAADSFDPENMPAAATVKHTVPRTVDCEIANPPEQANALLNRDQKLFLSKLGKDLRAALDPAARRFRANRLLELFKILLEIDPESLSHFCSAQRFDGLRLLGRALKVCCSVRSCDCGLGIDCKCPTNLAQPELLQLLLVLGDAP